MNRRKNPFRFMGRALAVLALVTQLIAPAALASTPGFDVANFFCAPSGALSADARAEAETFLSELFGDQQRDDDRGNSHCPLCVLVHGVPLPEQQPAPRIVFERYDTTPPRFETAFVYRPQGPPLGLRAPPSVSL